MWLAPVGKMGGTPEQFNEHYLACKNRGVHWREIRELANTPEYNKSIVDLGGGTLACEHECFRDYQYTLVDFSVEACSQAQLWSIRRGWTLNVICCDALEWLKTNEHRFHLTLCFGLLEYVSPHGLRELLARCPSDVLCLGTATAESYLQYPGRITVYSEEDIQEALADHGWKVTKRLDMSSHFWARCERVK